MSKIKSYFSIVNKQNDEEYIIRSSPIKEDIEALLPSLKSSFGDDLEVVEFRRV